MVLRRNEKFSEKLAAFAEQELSDGRIFGQADRAVIRVSGLMGFTETLQEVGANSPIRLIVRHGVRGNRLQSGEPCFWSLRFRDRGGVSNPCAGRGPYA